MATSLVVAVELTTGENGELRTRNPFRLALISSNASKLVV